MDSDISPVAVRAVRGSLYSVGASMVTLVLGITRSILLARLLLPEHFGVVALALFYLGLASRLRGFGLNMALIHRQEVDETFLRTLFTLRIGLDLATSGLLLMVAPFLQRMYPQMPGLGSVIAVLIVAYILSDLSSLQETLLRKRLAFSYLAWMDILASAVMTLVAPYLAWRGWGIWALVAERLSGLGMRFLLSWGPFRLWRPRFGWDREVVRWLWRYGRPSWVAANLTYLLDTFDDFWVGTALGKTPLGYYAKAYEFARYPRRVFANPLVTVFGPVFARVQDKRVELSRAFYRSALVILRTGFLIAGVFGLAMPEFIHYVIGEKWWPMLWTFRLMLVYIVLDPILMLIGNLLFATGRPDAMRDARIVQTVFFIPAVIVGASLAGINGVAVAADAMLLVGGWRLYRPLREMVDFSWRRLVVHPCVAMTLAWTVGFGLEQTFPDPSWQALLLKTGVFLSIFGGFLLISEREDYAKGLRLMWQALWGQRARVM
ncbi:MAG TPA: oligosaccharide flippase family protein [Caldilineae bacterium]|nr:oligosaccharide flippase family protein [Caldilineae bacterium]